MCRNERRFCRCGRNSAAILFRDNLLFPEILLNLFCPQCQDMTIWDEATMIWDCGWILEYDISGAQALLKQRGIKATATPAFLFDEGYLSWHGLSPGDLEINRELHQQLAPMIEKDLPQYLAALKSEWLKHVAALKTAGWRKAQAT